MGLVVVGGWEVGVCPFVFPFPTDRDDGASKGRAVAIHHLGV